MEVVFEVRVSGEPQKFEDQKIPAFHDLLKFSLEKTAKILGVEFEILPQREMSDGNQLLHRHV